MLSWKNTYESVEKNYMSYAWNEFGTLKDSVQLDEYLAGREYRHGEYCHYTKLHVLNDILGSKELWLSPVVGFNDKIEREEIKDSKLKFALCFSTGVNENLPLWYMYAGINGMGGRLKWSKSGIKHLLSEAVYRLKSTDDKFTRNLFQEDFEIEFRDIIYCSEKSLKYNTMFNHIIGEKEINKYRSEHNGFCKNIVWFYEKETRLMIKLKNEDILEGRDDCVVAMKISDKAFNALKIDMAPEVEGYDIFDYSKYGAIVKFINDTSSVNLSRYKGMVKMDLIKGNRKEIFDNFEVLYNNSSEEEVENIKRLINGK